MSALSLAAARLHLNVTVDDYDGELQGIIDAAEDWIAQKTGPLVATAGLTRTFDGGGMALLLPSGCTAVTSVTENGVTITDWTVNKPAGIVYGGNQIAPREFVPGTQNIVVTYTGYLAGYSTLPAGLLFAIKEKVRDMWMTQRVPGTRRIPGADANSALPDFDDLLEPYMQIPGFA